MATKTTRVKAEFFDGSTAETATRHYMCSADRAAFERQFGVNSGVLFEMGDNKSAYREEWTAYFSWRVLSRGTPPPFTGTFDEFIERAVDIEIEDQETDIENPTAPTAPPA